jgi:hypothetical protein
MAAMAGATVGQRAYTIHDTSKHMFSISVMRGTSLTAPPPKRAVIAFYRDIEAIKTARLMEVHRSLHDSWPETILDESFDITRETWHPCRELFVRSWSDAKLQEYCKKNGLDIMYLCGTNHDTLTLSLSLHIPEGW